MDWDERLRSKRCIGIGMFRMDGESNWNPNMIWRLNYYCDGIDSANQEKNDTVPVKRFWTNRHSDEIDILWNKFFKSRLEFQNVSGKVVKEIDYWAKEKWKKIWADWMVMVLKTWMNELNVARTWICWVLMKFLICVSQDDVIFFNGSTREKPDFDVRVSIFSNREGSNPGFFLVFPLEKWLTHINNN